MSQTMTLNLEIPEVEGVTPEVLANLIQEMLRTIPLALDGGDLIYLNGANCTAQDPATPEEIAEAREVHGSEECEIDEDACTSRADDGLWVRAWVWLHRPIYVTITDTFDEKKNSVIRLTYDDEDVLDFPYVNATERESQLKDARAEALRYADDDAGKVADATEEATV